MKEYVNEQDNLQDDEQDAIFDYEPDEDVDDDIVNVHHDKRLTDNELALKDFNKAAVIAKILVEEGYCVMLSKEEDLVILNYIETYYDICTPRNEVYFNHADELED